MRGAVRVLTTAGPYRVLAGRLVLPWALQGLRPVGRVLEIGAGSGAGPPGQLTGGRTGR